MKKDDGTALVALALRAAPPELLRLAFLNAALRIVAAYEREIGRQLNTEETESAANLTVMTLLKESVEEQKAKDAKAQQPGDDAPEEKATPAQRAEAERTAAGLLTRLRLVPGCGDGQQPQQPSA